MIDGRRKLTWLNAHWLIVDACFESRVSIKRADGCCITGVVEAISTVQKRLALVAV